jgi:TetR/AcrR family fatty acid metabolism transcriptional regulator
LFTGRLGKDDGCKIPRGPIPAAGSEVTREHGDSEAAVPEARGGKDLPEGGSPPAAVGEKHDRHTIVRSSMSRSERAATTGMNSRPRRSPPGRVKIADSLRLLLREKDFNAITTAEIAKNAGVTEALIYKYFKDKRDLLYQVLAEYLEHYIVEARLEFEGIRGAFNKLRKAIWTHINVYATDRVFAKILMLEVRSFSDYYTSEPYRLVKEYSIVLSDIIEEGVKNGEIRDDLPPSFMRQVILGGIEHVCLTRVVFGREIEPDSMTDDLTKIIFTGIAKDGQVPKKSSGHSDNFLDKQR